MIRAEVETLADNAEPIEVERPAPAEDQYGPVVVNLADVHPEPVRCWAS